MPVREAHRRELDERGFARLEGFIAPDRRQQLADRLEALYAAEGERAGGEFKREPGARRLANLVDKGETQATFPEAARAVLALDDPDNDALSAQAAGQSGFMK